MKKISILQFLAHPADRFGNGLQPYEDHIIGVLKRAGVWFNHIRCFASFSESEIEFIKMVISIVCFYHDLGKLDTESQRLLSDETLLKVNKMVNHVDAGVACCIKKSLKCRDLLNPFTVAAYIIHAHHLGLGFSPKEPVPFVGFYKHYLKGLKLNLPLDSSLMTSNSIRDMSFVSERCKSYNTKDTVENYVNKDLDNLIKRHNMSITTIVLKEDEFDVSCPFVIKNGTEINHADLEHVIRLILSIIVEADHGDTAESAGNEVCPKPVLDRTSPEERLENVKNYLKRKFDKFKSETHSENEIRRQEIRTLLQDIALKFDYSNAHVFNISAAVGCGKTIASLISGLKIQENQKALIGRSARRMYYVSPLNGPSKQAARELREIALNPGEDPFSLVGENHHDTNYKRMASESDVDEIFFTTASKNWDFPMTVSSCEQFLLTISGNKTRSLRKYWNLVNSVIIIDEYQALPPQILERLWDFMVFASLKLNTKFILVSGTPTDFYRDFNRNRLIVENISSKELDEKMSAMEAKRVKYVSLGKVDARGLAKIITEKTQSGSTLTIVQTTVTAAYLYALLVKKLGKRNVIYISRGLCNKDVDENIKSMIERLHNHEKIAVVSTSMLEAGIDVSFASVFHENSRFTSSLQAAGRCNRHGELEYGVVYLFELTPQANLVTFNPANNISRLVVRQFIKENKLHYKYCGEAFQLEMKYIREKLSEEKAEIKKNERELNFGNLAKLIHAIQPDGENVDGRTDVSILIKSKAEQSGLWCKLVNGDPFEISDFNDCLVVMKPNRADKLNEFIKCLTESEMVVTQNNKSYIDINYWAGPYDEIGYLSALLDPQAFE